MGGGVNEKDLVVGYVNLKTAQVMCVTCFKMIYPRPRFDDYIEENLMVIKRPQASASESWDCFSCHHNIVTGEKRGD